MDERTRRRYQAFRRKNPRYRAQWALNHAKMPDFAADWEEQSLGYFTREVEGFTIQLHVEVESVYPEWRDNGFGVYIEEDRRESFSRYEWQGNYPKPDIDRFPLGLPYTTFRWHGCNRQGDSGYFLPNDVEEEYRYHRRDGMTKQAAWFATKEWVEELLRGLFSSPLTNALIHASAWREGVELGSETMGTDYFGDDDAAVFETVWDHSMIECAIAKAKETTKKLCERSKA